MSDNTLTFQELRNLIAGMPDSDAAAVAAARAREAALTKPPGALGRLEDLTAWLCGWQRRHPPSLDHARAVVFAANHGIVSQGVSAFPADVTAQMVDNFAAGGAAINQLAVTVGAGLSVIPLDLDRPTADFTEGAAMTADDCAAGLAAGVGAVGEGTDILLVGEMGIGNTTAAAALSAALFDGPARDWVGPGTGLDDDGIARKARVVEAALKLHGAALDDPLEALRRVGGREIAAMAGAVLGARLASCPVILDGFVSTAAAAVLHRLDARALDHCLAGHVSAEPGHRRLLERLGKRPLLNLDMRLGEASGAAIALGVVRSAVAAHIGMATFAEAGVSDGG